MQVSVIGLRSIFYLICINLVFYRDTAYAQDHSAIDRTIEPEVRGSEVVETVVSRIERSAIFENDYGYIRRIAWVETRDGLSRTATFRNGYHGGLWQVDEVVFQETIDTVTYPQLLEKYQQIQVEFAIDWSTTRWEDLRKPLYSGLAVYLYMVTIIGINESIPLNIHDQADHWKRNYRLHVEVTVEEFVTLVGELETMTVDCHRDIDLYIVLDSSGSIGSTSYEIAKDFLVDVVSGFIIGENNVRVGLVRYGTTAELIFDLDDSFDKDVILNAIRSVGYLDAGNTATGDGILLMAEYGFTATSGTRPPNLAIPHVGIVLTDGHSNHGVSVTTAASIARNQSIQMFAFGIGGGINDVELLEIAGSQDRVFRVDDFTNINDARALIVQGSCKSNVKAYTNTTYEGNLAVTERRSFEFTIPEEGISIQVEVTTGLVILYGSYSNPDPSPIWHDVLIRGIDHSRDVFIPHPTVNKKKRQVVQAVPFYCNLIGVHNNSTFSISAANGNVCNCGCIR